jgi:hypothetical protein
MISSSVNSSKTIPQPVDCVEDWVDHSTCISDDSVALFKGEIHIILHPTYDVPCPLLRLWNDKTGEIIDQEVLNSLLISSFSQVTVTGITNKNLDEIGSNKLDTGEGIDFRKTPTNVTDRVILTAELHPSCPSKGFYYSIHLCEIEKSFRLMMENQEKQKPDCSIQPSDISSKRLMLLSWFTMFGKYVGISITPHIYRKYFPYT